jgi:hypothetical protein
MTRQIVVSVCAAFLLGGAGGCSRSSNGEFGEGQQMPPKSIKQVQEAHTDEWMALPGVEGTAIGLFKGKPCIKVFASVKAQELRARIPATVEGYPVIIEETGVFRALDEPQ